jgi:hypothetical protein
MAYIGGDRVLLFGGNTADSVNDDDTWVYDFSANTWTATALTGPTPQGRRFHAMAYLGGDKVLMSGGFASSMVQDSWVFDLSDGTWGLQLSGAQVPARSHHAMARSGGDTAVLFGGFNTAQQAMSETWVYTLSSNSWTQVSMSSGAPPPALTSHAMGWSSINSVTIFGGLLGDNSTPNGQTWEFDRANASWKAYAGNQPAARFASGMAHITAPALVGARTLVLFGGSVAGGLWDETWVFMP